LQRYGKSGSKSEDGQTLNTSHHEEELDEEMSDTFKQILRLVEAGEVRISDHGYDELAIDGIFAKDVITGITHALIVEDYPEYPEGPHAY